MIEQTISEWFRKNGWTWRLRGGKIVQPTEQDVLDALDQAAKQLSDQPVGTILQVGRLAIERTTRGHDVYMFVGEYL